MDLSETREIGILIALPGQSEAIVIDGCKRCASERACHYSDDRTHPWVLEVNWSQLPI